MSTTITFRADEPLRERLERRAAASGKSLSALVREILEKAVAESSVGRRAGHLKARLSLRPGSSDPSRTSIRERNWRA
jgi:plasmid stability protein